jgi:PKD repeat protein
MKYINIAFVFAFLLTTYSVKLNAQISIGGTPPSFLYPFQTKATLAAETITPPNLTTLQQEDRKNDSLGKPYRMAKMLDCDICMAASGHSEALTPQTVIWQLQLTAPGALGLQLIFEKFKLSQESKLYIYNEDKTFVIGAFTSANNQSSGKFATEIIPGESCILEYVTNNLTEIPSFCISQIGYVYRGMQKVLSTKLKSASSDCEVNIRCSPEGDNWNNISRATAMIIIDGLQCTGTLLNNTAKDYKNYLATAFHCIDGHEATLQTAMFYFNRTMSGCSGSSTLNSGNTVTGAELRASIPLYKGADGALLEISGEIPLNYNVYWAGWDLNDTLVGGGVCIHHPEGDPQKISTVRSIWHTTTWKSKDTIIGAENKHWDISFEATTNGHGITEDGSSGAGLFGPNELYMGTLSGGISTCSSPYLSNLFGKFSYNWDQYDNLPEHQFKPWLDPLNTGIKKLSGADKTTTNEINWSSSLPIVIEQGTVTFKDDSKINTKSRKWKFSGGTPSTATTSVVNVQYNTPGLYEVTLEVSDSSKTYTKIRTNYIYVTSPSYWIRQNSGFKTKYRGISGFSVVDSSVVWAWAFDGTNSSKFILEYTKTTNGGKVWTPDSIAIDSLKGYGIANMFALGPDTAYAALFNPTLGGGLLLMTADSGKSWKNILPTAFSAPKGFPDFVHFFSKKDGLIVGDPNSSGFEIYTTADSGQTWTAVVDSLMPDINSGETAGAINAYATAGDSLLWFGTSKGRVFRTSNYGHTWDASVTGLKFVSDIYFSDSLNGFALYTYNTFVIKKTSDGGKTWTDYDVPENCYKGKWAFLPGDSSYWVTIGSASPYGSSFSTDSAQTFAIIDKNIQYSSLKFYNHDIGWAGCFNLDSVTGGIYKWNRQKRIVVNPPIYVPVSETYKADERLSVYPNPATSQITIQKGNIQSETVRVSVVSIQGKIMADYFFKCNHSDFLQQINIGDLPTGVYILMIKTDRYTGTCKFIRNAF